MPNKAREKFKTMHNVFDNFTNRLIFKMISEGHFEGLEATVSVGKEANIFSAVGQKGRIILKIYRLEACDFNRMYDYIKEDKRYANLKGKKRKIIFTWVQREYRNLLIARQAGVSCPTPIKFLGNIILLEFIGLDGEVAPKLKDKKPEDPKKFFDKVVENMKKLYKSGLVHADLSPFNILNFNEVPILIDFSQTTTTDSTSADEFIRRDVRNVVNHFKKLGLKLSEDKVLAKILK
ncbi:MAG: serine protein kinase RIO [Nanoarchaeota archaeon]|nr:serine protein kinase RIO [Nanoarchaeota archaeon]